MSDVLDDIRSHGHDHERQNEVLHVADTPEVTVELVTLFPPSGHAQDSHTDSCGYDLQY